ncbi:transposase [Nocardia sp. NPDC004168]|uniref:transposase n=1 Tax=Nocardia sp. NPDC004168 TaxID=3154452 RepID=UPI0033A711FD
MGPLTGPNPVDRGKPGSKIHVLSDRAAIVLSVGVSSANTNDAEALRPLVEAIPAIRSRRAPRRRKPGNLHADKGIRHRRTAAMDAKPRDRRRHRPRRHRILQRLGPHRWVIERTIPSRPATTASTSATTARPPTSSLPHPRCGTNLLQETRQISHIRHTPRPS